MGNCAGKKSKKRSNSLPSNVIGQKRYVINNSALPTGQVLSNNVSNNYGYNSDFNPALLPNGEALIKRSAYIISNNPLGPVPGLTHSSSKSYISGGEPFNSYQHNSLSKSSYALQQQQQWQLQPLKTFIALYNYDARTDEDLSFKRGDVLEIINDTAGDWWLARLKNYQPNKKCEGYIPSNYVAAYKSLESQPWYFGKIKRIEAERMLMSGINGHGSFLVRDSETRKNDYSLSIRDEDGVKHYRIRQMDEGGFFIARRSVFSTLPDLVAYYADHSDGLCVNLRKACIQVEKPETRGLSYKDQWEIQKSTLTFTRRIGQGQFGEVYEGLWNMTTPVAIKTLRPGTMNADDFLAEAQIMKNLRHPKLIQLYAVCTKDEPIYIVTELMRNGSLLEYLQTKGRTLKLPLLVEIAAQIACGMAYLESQNYIHRDLAARNILVGENNIVKIADFGLARLTQQNAYEAKAGSRIPIKWTAPEAANHYRFSVKSDVWSFGILLTEIVTYGRVPYPGMTNTEVLQQVQNGYRMPCPDKCPHALYSIMLRCWSANEMDRPTFDTLQWELEDFFHLPDTEYLDSTTMLIR